MPADTTLIDVTRRHAAEQGDKTALKFEGRETTYAEFERHSNKVANGLSKAGVKSGEHVGYLGKNTDRYFEAWWASMKIGAIMVPIGWRLAVPEVRYMVEDSEIRVLFLGRELLQTGLDLKKDLPQLRLIAVEDGELPADIEPFAAWRDSQSDAPPSYRITSRDIVIQLYTSGTTGKPKGAMLAQRSFVTHLGNVKAADVSWNRWAPSDVSFVPMPVAHIGGSGWGLYGFFFGAKMIIERQFDIDSFFDQVEKERITKMFIVPAALQMLVRHPRARTVNYDCISIINYGASPISPTLLKECIDVFKCGFAQMYGMTETIGTIVALPPEDHDPNGNKRMASAGKALPEVELAIIDDNGRHLAPGQVGEIITRSIANMAGYWKLPDATAATLDKEGWLHTGDAGYLDEDGYLYIHDRIKDMICSGAENIYPTEVENAVAAHPDVAEVAVIGVPDEKWGEAVKAFVVLRTGRSIGESELLAWLRGRIGGFKMPKTIEMIDALPRNPSGKILKKDLRAKYWAGKERQVG